jgi:sRNA-binding protein
LVEAFPLAFTFKLCELRALGIREGIMSAAPDIAHLKATLGFYCNTPSYLMACVAGAARIDLAGQPAGVVTDEQAAAALRLAGRKNAGCQKTRIAERAAARARRFEGASSRAKSWSCAAAGVTMRKGKWTQ